MIRAKTSLILSAASLIAITACAPLNDPNNPNRQAQTGALIGAGVGALAGAAAGNDPEERRRNAAAGALIGAAGGAIVGNELDSRKPRCASRSATTISTSRTPVTVSS